MKTTTRPTRTKTKSASGVEIAGIASGKPQTGKPQSGGVSRRNAQSGLTEQQQSRLWAKLRFFACVAAFGIMIGCVAAIYSKKFEGPLNGPEFSPDVIPATNSDAQQPSPKTEPADHQKNQAAASNELIPIRFVSDRIAPEAVTTAPRGS